MAAGKRTYSTSNVIWVENGLQQDFDVSIVESDLTSLRLQQYNSSGLDSFPPAA